MSVISLNEYGSGKTTLLVFPAWSHPVEKETLFLNILSKKFRVISIQLPGYFGNPDASKFNNFNFLAREITSELNKNKITNPILLGFSLGCRLIMEFNNVYPNNFQQIFVTCPIKAFKVPIWARPLITSEFILNILRKNHYFTRQMVEIALRKITNDPNSVLIADKVTLLGAFDSLLALLNSKIDLNKELKRATFIYGDNDPFYLDAKIKNPKFLKVVSGASHNCVIKHEHEVAKMIEESLR